MLTPPDHPLFFVRRSDGLIARCSAFLHMWRFARQVGGQTFVLWDTGTRASDASWSHDGVVSNLLWDLPSFYATGGARELVFSDYRGSPRGTLRQLAEPEFAAGGPAGYRREDFVGGPFTFLEKSPQKYRFHDETKQAAVDHVAELWRMLPLNLAVQRALHEARRQIGGAPYAAVHVRRGDIIGVLRHALPGLAAGVMDERTHRYFYHLCGRTAPLHSYFPLADEQLALGRRIVFFSDTPELAGAFLDRYGPDRVIDGTTLSPPGLLPIQRAMIDFQLITRARAVISTSTGYSLFAAEIGSIPHRIATQYATVDDLTRYVFDDVLQGEAIPADLHQTITTIVAEQHQRVSRRLPASPAVG